MGAADTFGPRLVRTLSVAPQNHDLAISTMDAGVAVLNHEHRRGGGSRLVAVTPGRDVVRLGLSHPCTTFDKWRLIPVIDDHTSDDPAVVDLVHTFF